MDNVFSLRDHTRLMSRSPRQQRQRSEEITATLRSLRERAGLSMAELAAEMGFKGPSSYQRYEDPDLFKRDYLPPRMVEALARTLVGRGDPPIKEEELFTFWHFDRIPTIPKPPGAVDFPMPVIGEVQAGVWREADSDTEFGEFGKLLVKPTPYLHHRAQYALIVRGESMNKIARDGDYLICADVIKSAVPIADGDLVVVERTRDGGSIRETTVKRLVREPDGRASLMPESTDPRFQQVLQPDYDGAEDAEVRIKAVVLMVIKVTHPTAHLGYRTER